VTRLKSEGGSIAAVWVRPRSVLGLSGSYFKSTIFSVDRFDPTSTATK
jgi:hypothetical protein